MSYACTKLKSVYRINMKSLLVLLLAVAVASAAKTHQKRSAAYQASLNDYMDQVITNLQAYVVDNNLNQMVLPNVTEGFSAQPLLITYTGHLYLYEGLISNLESIRRYGDTWITYKDKQFAFAGNLGVDTADVDYTYAARVIRVVQAYGTVDAGISNLDLTVSISADLEKYQFTVGDLAVNKLGSVSAKLRGNVLTDWLANIVLAIVTRVIKDDVADQISETGNEIIKDMLDRTNELITSAMAS